MKSTHRCMGVHGDSKGTFSRRHARITGYLTSTTATSAAATHPCRWFRIQESVCVPTEKETTHMGMRRQVLMRTRLRFGGIGVRTRLRIGEYRVALAHFCNHAWQCKGSLQDLDHAPRIFSCLLTLHQQDLLLSHRCQHR